MSPTISIYEELLSREFGALKLRQYEAKHLLTALFISSAMAWLLVGTGTMLAKYLATASLSLTEDKPRVQVIEVKNLKARQIKIKNVSTPIVMPVAPTAGIKPVAVLDEKVPDSMVVPTVDQIAKHNDSEKGTEGEVVVVGSTPEYGLDQDIYPTPEEFVVTEKLPEIISAPAPTYPEFAQKAGITGNVLVQFLVTRTGAIRNITILRAVPPGVGFEEAAVDAVKEWKMKPAVNNGQPVPVWVKQTVHFKLK